MTVNAGVARAEDQQSRRWIVNHALPDTASALRVGPIVIAPGLGRHRHLRIFIRLLRVSRYGIEPPEPPAGLGVERLRVAAVRTGLHVRHTDEHLTPTHT